MANVIQIAIVKTLIKQVWKSNAYIGLAIASCESGFRPNAINYANYDGVPDFGIFQLHGVKLLSARENIVYAYEHKFKPSGLQPWVSSKNCWQNKISVI